MMECSTLQVAVSARLRRYAVHAITHWMPPGQPDAFAQFSDFMGTVALYGIPILGASMMVCLELAIRKLRKP